MRIRLMAVVSMVGLAAAAARAQPDDASLYSCHPLAKDATIHVSFAPGTSVFDLSLWLTGFTCKNVVFATGVAKRATKVDVIAPGAMTSKQAVALFVDAVEAAGLEVVDKGDTFVIKPGPGTPKSCPDLAEAAPPPEPVAPTAAADADADENAQLVAGVTAIDATHIEVTRAVADTVLAQLPRSVRIVPSVLDGKPAGFKLYAIRPSSFAARLGFANGDRVTAVNGLSLLTAADAAATAPKLKNARMFTFDLVRRGKPARLVITVR